MASLLQIGESANLTAELVNSYTIGAFAEVAGISGGVGVQNLAENLLVSLGVELSDGTVLGESGAATAVIAASVRQSLKKAAQKAGKTVAAKPSQWGKLFAFSAAGFGVYSWLTATQQAALEDLRGKREILVDTLETLSPQDRLKVALELAGAGSSFPWVGLGVGAGVLILGTVAYRAWR